MPDRSRVIHFAEAQASIPERERSACVWQRGTLDVAFALPTPPKEQAPHIQDEIYIIVRGEACLFTTTSGTHLSGETSYSWLQESSINLSTLARTSLCGACSTALMAAMPRLS